MATRVFNQSSTKAQSPLSPKQLLWQRFRNHKMSMFGMIVLTLILLYCTVGAIFMPEAYANFNDTRIKFQPPSLAHPFGTDSIGRDLMARTISGGQISLIIGALSMLVATSIGTLVGAIAGFYGGWIDSLLMRFTEALFTVPRLFLLIVIGKFFALDISNIQLFGRTFNGSVVVIIMVVGLTSWMYLARIVRAQCLSLKEQDFIYAAHCIGTSDLLVIFQHLLPNTLAPIIVSGTLGMATAILAEAYVSFLGLGVQPPMASWGNLLVGSQNYLQTAPWLWIFPGFLITLTVLAINFVGDGLRDAFDPKSQKLTF